MFSRCRLDDGLCEGKLQLLLRTDGAWRPAALSFIGSAASACCGDKGQRTIHAVLMLLKAVGAGRLAALPRLLSP